MKSCFPAVNLGVKWRSHYRLPRRPRRDYAALLSHQPRPDDRKMDADPDTAAKTVAVARPVRACYRNHRRAPGGHGVGVVQHTRVTTRRAGPDFLAADPRSRCMTGNAGQGWCRALLSQVTSSGTGTAPGASPVEPARDGISWHRGDGYPAIARRRHLAFSAVPVVGVAAAPGRAAGVHLPVAGVRDRGNAGRHRRAGDPRRRPAKRPAMARRWLS